MTRLPQAAIQESLPASRRNRRAMTPASAPRGRVVRDVPPYYGRFVPAQSSETCQSKKAEPAPIVVFVIGTLRGGRSGAWGTCAVGGCNLCTNRGVREGDHGEKGRSGGDCGPSSHGWLLRQGVCAKVPTHNLYHWSSGVAVAREGNTLLHRHTHRGTHRGIA